jgi:thiol-disulfide isomerase/thioredoxin
MKNKFLMLLAIGLIGFSCNNKNYIGSFDILLRTDFTQNQLKKIDFVIIIPNEGCSGCITYAEEFYSLNKDKNNMIFVFTNIISMKNLKYKININANTTLLDTKNRYLFAYPKEKQIYPCILKIKNGKIDQIKFQTPTEESLKSNL